MKGHAKQIVYIIQIDVTAEYAPHASPAADVVCNVGDQSVSARRRRGHNTGPPPEAGLATF
jgi:hypothetical protein